MTVVLAVAGTLVMTLNASAGVAAPAPSSAPIVVPAAAPTPCAPSDALNNPDCLYDFARVDRATGFSLVSGDSYLSVSAPAQVALGGPVTVELDSPYPLCVGGAPTAGGCITSAQLNIRQVGTNLSVTVGSELTNVGGGLDAMIQPPATSLECPDPNSLSCDIVLSRDTSHPALDPFTETFAFSAHITVGFTGSDPQDAQVWVEKAFTVGGTDETPPVAAFTVQDLSASSPGEFVFTATSTSPAGRALSEGWDFGDGATGAGSVADHIYTAPGTFTVTLTTTDTEGLSSTATKQVTVAAPKLTVGISFPGQNGNVPNPLPNTTIPIAVTVHASNGVGALSDLRFTGDPLTFAPAALAAVTSGPDPALQQPFSLEPGDTKTFTYQVKAKDLGVVHISTEVTGKDAHSSTLTAQDEITMQIGRDLDVELTVSPSATIHLDDDADGKPIPQAFDLDVAVTNPFDHAITGVTLDDTPVLESLSATHEVTPHIVKQDASKPAPTLSIGTIAAGATVHVHVPFLAIADGRERISWRVTAVNPSANTALSGVGHVTVAVDPKYLLSVALTAQTDGDAKAGFDVVAGESYGLTLDLVNVSNAESVQVDQVIPTTTGNAAGGNPFDADNPPGPVAIAVPSGATPAAPLGPCDTPHAGPPDTLTQAQFYLPWSGELNAGDPMNLAANVITVNGGGTRGTVTYTISGTVTEDDGTTRPLTADDLLITAGAVADQPTQVADVEKVDDSVPPPTPADAKTIAWNFTVGAALGAAEWWCGTFSAVGALGATVIKGGFYAGQLGTRLGQAIEYGLSWYASLTPEERKDYFDYIADVVNGQPWAWQRLGVTAANEYNQVTQPVEKWWQQGFDAWNSGDTNALAQWAGEAGTYGSLEIASNFVGGVWARSVKSLQERAEIAKLPTAAKAVANPKAATALPVGIDLLAGHQDLIDGVYGIAEQPAQQVSKLAKAEDAMIAVRSRNPSSILAEELWGAENKPASIKIKSVDDIDTQLLGYPDTVTVNGITGPSSGLVVFRDPAVSKAYLAAHSAGLDPVLLQAAESRLALRETEWAEHLSEYQEFTKTGMPVEFNYAANGLRTTEPLPGYNLQPFRMQTVSDGTSVLLTDKGAGAFVPITGDVDVVAVTSTNGTLLDPQQRLAIYQSLQSIDGIGVQHGDTISWLVGDKSQVKLLTDHVGDNAERLLVFDPVGGARTATIDAAHTTFTAKDNSLNGIWYVGAYKTPVRQAFENVVVTFHGASETIVPWISPTSWYLTGRSTLNGLGGPPGTDGPTTGGNDGKLGNCPWQFSTGDGANALIPDGNGGFLQFVVGQGWVPYTPQVICVPPTGGGAGQGATLRRAAIRAAALPTIEVLPQSALNANAPKGATSLTLIPLSLVDPALDPATTPWFAAGERIVIDPGGPDQEYATIVADVGAPAIRLDRPLAKAHPAGAMVTVVRATTVPSTSTSHPTSTSAPAGTSGSTQLADTGVDPSGGLGAALALILAGLSVVVVGRRRRPGAHA